MAVVPIMTVPDKVLTTKCKKVKEVDSETKKIVQDLLDTLLSAKDPEGAGLAAPQIGITKRICIARNFYLDPANPEKELSQEIVLINPRIISKSKDKITDWEACLSIPEIFGKVERSKKVKIRALNENGEDIKINATGFLARITQHEIDHLVGILFTSKVVGKTITEEELDALEDQEAKIFAA